MKKIAVLTSGGDAPGMNAAIRAVVRLGIASGLEVIGTNNGYSGLIAGEFRPLGARDVSGIIQSGGTILGSSRSAEFETESGRQKALDNLVKSGIEALVVIGGNGSQTGAHLLNEMGFPVVGIASTIDNDLYGTDQSIGVDTALNIVLEAIDRIKVTATSHHRAHIVETMGRSHGYLALTAGICGGAEFIVIPEVEVEPKQIAQVIEETYARGKSHCLIVVAEGAYWNATRLQEHFKENASLGFSIRTTILGHVQRGGAPTAFDRMLGTRIGVAAVKELVSGRAGSLLGLACGEIAATPYADVVTNLKKLDLSVLDTAEKLAR
ncbi:6-phosphofructokinase 1 [Dehalogenimonas formicexedens]|uniref:ATP-dependent 6-phosphofructokinase n=1 Tax=Dehalogenimonas formicexedens TaxID=1839801 RepID=A0A1P8F8I6_9CHLR|nr:6-phosphofructokinase [Dehalogenimonas formicexedens]APV44750.1 6-phosphofructokinase 1 [Dehalogenimonas formicexedens]